MNPGAAVSVLLCADGTSANGDLRAALEQAGYGLDCHTAAGEPNDVSSYALVVVDGTERPVAAQALCRGLRRRLGESFVPILLGTDEAAPDSRLSNLQSGADAYLLRPFAPAELLAQVQTFLRLKERHDHLADKTDEVNRVNKRLHAAYQQIDQELELARRIQESFLPQSLPQVPEARFAVYYKPCGRVGGDFYDVFRLDEEHVGLYVADAMGHGVPASLLTIFVKKGVRAKEIYGQTYRLVPPGEVLKRLNQDMIEQALSENP